MTIAHKRERQSLHLLLKKLKFSPIVSIQGPRQCGKSFLARELLPARLSHSKYQNLDQKTVRDFAEKNPRTFLTTESDELLIIDEVQKVPDLFDEMKDLVDRRRKPGQFVILGSTEFSHETQIRESLTGRLSKIRLYPMNCSEICKLPINSSHNFPFTLQKLRVERRDLIRYLNNGGLPGIFSVKSDLERSQLFSDWLKLTVERDIHQIKKFNLDSDIAYNILEKIALLEIPTLANIVGEMQLPTSKIKNYLTVFQNLFTIFCISPFRGSSGKNQYFLTDLGLLHYLRAGFEKKLRTWVYLELLSQLSYKGISNTKLFFYQTSKRKIIDIIYEEPNELKVLKVLPKETFDLKDFEIIKAFEKKYSAKKLNKKKISFCFLNGATEPMKIHDISIFPWESII